MICSCSASRLAMPLALVRIPPIGPQLFKHYIGVYNSNLCANLLASRNNTSTLVRVSSGLALRNYAPIGKTKGQRRSFCVKGLYAGCETR